MSNPYEGTPLWARWHSEQRGFRVTQAVLDATDGPVRCDVCGVEEEWDEGFEAHLARLIGEPALAREPGVRRLSLDDDYCFGCGAVVCDKCAKNWKGMGPHEQSAHYSAPAPAVSEKNEPAG